jgi:hypothetical protein
MQGWKQTFVSIAVGFSALLLVSCGGGGGGDGGGGAPPAAQPNTVSGSVQAPGGQITFNQPQGLLQQFAQFISPSAYASLSGLSPVPDGSPVYLARLNGTGTGSLRLASTTTTGGRYSFNLANLGLQFSNDLIISVVGPAGKEMRAFVGSSATVDVDPGSELAVRLVLEQITATTGATLNRFTSKEITDISAALRLFVTAGQFSGGVNLETTITTIRNAVIADADLIAFIAAAAADGQTTEGPGDVGNYFPFGQGSAWNFSGTTTSTVLPTTPFNYETTVSITGTKLLAGVTATIFSETNPNGSLAEEQYRTKDTSAIVNHGTNNANDFITQQLVPYQEAQFPLNVGESFQSVNKTGLDFPIDFDNDGKNEKFNATSQVTVVAFETVTVPAGTFQNAAKIETKSTLTVIQSSNGAAFPTTETQTAWFAPGVGPVKIVTSSDFSINSEELIAYVVNGQGKGNIPLAIATGVASANSDTTDPGPSGIASDGSHYFVVSCQDLGVTPGIIGVFLTGGVAGQPFPIAPRTCASNIGIRAAFDGTNYLVVFSKDGIIWGVRVSASGSILDGSGGFAISSGTPNTITNFDPTVAFDGTNYLVVWGKFIGDYNIYGAGVTPNGQVLGEFPIFTASGEQISPDLAFDGTNYLVVWSDTRTGSGPSTDTNVYGARVSPAGSVLDTSGIAIATAPGFQGGASVAFDGTNHFVVWSDVPQLGSSPPVSQIFGKRVKPDGSLLDGPSNSSGIPINVTSFGKSEPTVAFDGTNYLVAWIVGAFPNNPPAGVYGAKMSPSGQVIDGQPDTLGISLSGPPQNSDARFAYPIAYSNQSNTLLTWVNNRELAGTTKSVQGALLFP